MAWFKAVPLGEITHELISSYLLFASVMQGFPDTTHKQISQTLAYTTRSLEYSKRKIRTQITLVIKATESFVPLVDIY